MTTRSKRSGMRQQAHRPSSMAACEACRRQKMRCIRPNISSETSKDPTEPCERCRRHGRSCNIPSPRPLGRKPGAVGRYQGLEKAYRKMQAELKKAPAPGGEIYEIANNLSDGDGKVMDLLLSNMQSDNNNNNNTNNNNHLHHHHHHEESRSNQPTDEPRNQYPAFHAVPLTIDTAECPLTEQIQTTPATVAPVHDANTYTVTSDVNCEPVSNPLALLADASGAAQALSPASNVEAGSERSPAGQSIGRHLLHRPGYISLGLQLSRDSLESGLDALFVPPSQNNHYSNYFRPPDGNPPRDVGPDLDPVELGLISMTEAYDLFPMCVLQKLTMDIILFFY